MAPLPSRPPAVLTRVVSAGTRSRPPTRSARSASSGGGAVGLCSGKEDSPQLMKFNADIEERDISDLNLEVQNVIKENEKKLAAYAEENEKKLAAYAEEERRRVEKDLARTMSDEIRHRKELESLRRRGPLPLVDEARLLAPPGHRGRAAAQPLVLPCAGRRARMAEGGEAEVACVEIKPSAPRTGDAISFP